MREREMDSISFKDLVPGVLVVPILRNSGQIANPRTKTNAPAVNRGVPSLFLLRKCVWTISP
jgi:hypothetical protein